MPDPRITEVFELLKLSEESHRATFLVGPADECPSGYTRATFIQAEGTSGPEESVLAELERAPERAQGGR
jgi:hypothetical protein